MNTPFMAQHSSDPIFWRDFVAYRAARVDELRAALRAQIRRRSVQDLAKDVLAIARAGLQRRAVLDGKGRDESRFLDILDEIAASGRCPAEEKLAVFNGRWQGSVDPIYTEFAY